MAERFANQAETTLASPLSAQADDVSLRVASASAFPAEPTFRVRLDTPDGYGSVAVEIVKVTAVAGAVWTAERAAEPIAAEQACHDFPAGSRVALVWTADSLAAYVAEHAGGGNGGNGSNWAYVHHQLVASSSWTVDHALGGYPSVTVVDSGGSKVHGNVTYPSDQRVVITFGYPFAGQAFFS